LCGASFFSLASHRHDRAMEMIHLSGAFVMVLHAGMSS
jgi:hypothetical protein